MVLRLVLSASVLCGLSAASGQPLRVLNTSTARSMYACTQLALQNAVNPARQKKLMQDNVMAGGINYAYVLGGNQTKHGTKIVARAKIGDRGDCVIPLTQERLSTRTRFELRKLPSNFTGDSMTRTGIPVCAYTANGK